MIRRPPKSTLFPYPTPFRSRPPPRQITRGRRDRRHGERTAGDQQAMRRRPDAQANPGQGEREQLARLRGAAGLERSEEHTSELQSRQYLVCRLLLEKKN